MNSVSPIGIRCMPYASILLLVALLYSCTKDEVKPLSELTPGVSDYEKVTGFDSYDDVGQYITSFGNPNQLTGPIDCFPIPAIDVMTIFTTDSISTMWIVPADRYVEQQTVNFDSLYSNDPLEASRIIDVSESTVPVPEDVLSYTYATQALPSGYYRFYFERRSDGFIFCHNIHHLETDPGPDYHAEQATFWE